MWVKTVFSGNKSVTVIVPSLSSSLPIFLISNSYSNLVLRGTGVVVFTIWLCCVLIANSKKNYGNFSYI